ncbi:3-hydroxyacyl-CoA dehydrogenase family protein [Actinokineospora sp. NBRC 105648]|uniref:3-hydroxyacyl-CoA dehydrogenase family protein n=1 Tax=Actinokineospora sp. NBRC 105648 TaxID=3032206 RepID=UPI0024A604D4|nr:3-hydroxyacyl-CoA dehydrogenase family protein [Actinokineospora sp. NBRC 105648]GLZ40297.1 3-hydroxybutyryl-CoA dehydrogenase [Actinokineospora sp. NBRC 105648]
MSTVAVLGAGTMGTGIAQCLAQAGWDVVVVDPDAGARERAGAHLADQVRLATLLRRVAPGDDVVGRVRWAADAAALGAAGFVIECVPERVPLKEGVFRVLDRTCPPDAVLASATSAIPIARLAACTARPELVLGLHFMNPAPLKDTVEVVRGDLTGADTVDRALALLEGMGKRGVVVADGAGFVINRVLQLAINEAAGVVLAGTADAAAVDELFESCLGHPMGPLRTADLIGLDNVVDTLRVLAEHTGDARFTPSDLLVELVESGRLGRKSGHGFHEYRNTR